MLNNADIDYKKISNPILKPYPCITIMLGKEEENNFDKIGVQLWRNPDEMIPVIINPQNIYFVQPHVHVDAYSFMMDSIKNNLLLSMAPIESVAAKVQNFEKSNDGNNSDEENDLVKVLWSDYRKETPKKHLGMAKVMSSIT